MKIRVNIAANAKAVTLGQYIDYCNAVDAAERVRVITGKSMDSIKLLQASVIDEIIMKFEAAVQLCTDGFERKVRIGAIELGFIPDLTEMTFGEYVDLDSACTGLYKDGKLDADAALKMMSILYRPVTAKWAGRYDIEKYDSTKVGRYIDTVKMLTLDHVLNVLVFFSSLEQELYGSSLDYLAKEITEIVTEAARTNTLQKA
jgi:hypothetical protein